MRILLATLSLLCAVGMAGCSARGNNYVDTPNVTDPTIITPDLTEPRTVTPEVRADNDNTANYTLRSDAAAAR